MFARRCTISLSAMFFILGCVGGNVQTEVLPTNALDSPKKLKGVIVYQPAYFRLRYDLTARFDSGGKAVVCVPVTHRDSLVVMPNLEAPFLIRNKSGPFSAAKFSVTLSNGMLASVNAEPSQQPSDLLAAALPVVGKKLLGSEKACDASPQLVEIRRMRIKDGVLKDS